MESVYYDPARTGSFGGLASLARASEKRIADVRDWTRGEDTYTLHKPVRRRFLRRKTISKGIDDLWQADLVDVSSLASSNDGNRFLLTVIDVYSRYAFVKPLRNKSSREIVRAFSELFEERKPVFLQTDKGTEFLNAPFQKLLSDANIKFYTSENDDIKCALVERFNRTLKDRMWRYFTRVQSHRYLDVLDKIVSSYNATYHRMIKMAPERVSESNPPHDGDPLKPSVVSRLKPKLEIGDKVRISMTRRAFKKGYLPGWTEEVFAIKTRVPSKPWTYVIQDLLG